MIYFALHSNLNEMQRLGCELLLPPYKFRAVVLGYSWGMYEKTNGSKEDQVCMLAGSLVSHECRNIIEIFSTLEIKKYIN